MNLLRSTGIKKYKEILAWMKSNDVDFILLTQNISFEYLIFSKVPFICIINRDGQILTYTHAESIETVKLQTWLEDVYPIYPYNIGLDIKNNVEENYIDKTVQYVKSFNNKKKIGIDYANTSIELFELIKSKLPKYEFLDCNSILLECFQIKTEEEIACIKKAARIAETGVIKSKELLDRSEGITENEIAAFAEYNMRKLNIDGFYVRSSVTSGLRSIQLGSVDSSKIIAENDLVDVDYSPVYKNYYADICRVISRRKMPPKIIERCKIIEEALDIAINNIKPGIVASEIDFLVKKHFKKNNADGQFIHHTAHPVGNSWGIMITSNSNSIIQEGMVFALEPGLYNSVDFGIRIEDNVYVTKKGAVNMMKLPRMLE